MKENKMVVGVLKIELRLAQVHSLKEKRGQVKRMLNSIRSTYHVSAAEVSNNDLWQDAVLGITVVGNETAFVNSCLDQILNYVEDLDCGELVGQQMEIIHL
jgi:hypothetical protein